MSHLDDVNLSYLQHLKRAWGFSSRALRAATILFIHGLVPDWFEHTGSQIISKLDKDMGVKNDSRD